MVTLTDWLHGTDLAKKAKAKATYESSAFSPTPSPRYNFSDTESDGTMENESNDDGSEGEWCSDDDTSEAVYVPRPTANVRPMNDSGEKEKIKPVASAKPEKREKPAKPKQDEDWQIATYDEEEDYDMC